MSTERSSVYVTARRVPFEFWRGRWHLDRGTWLQTKMPVGIYNLLIINYRITNTRFKLAQVKFYKTYPFPTCWLLYITFAVCLRYRWRLSESATIDFALRRVTYWGRQNIKWRIGDGLVAELMWLGLELRQTAAGCW